MKEITSNINQIKKKLGIELSTQQTQTSNFSVTEIKLQPIAEGYFKKQDNTVSFHGDSYSDRGFCFKYSIKLDRHDLKSIPGNGNPAMSMISIVLQPEDAVDLESVLIMDLNEPATTSTYYSHDVLLTHISGPCPMISFPSKDYSFMFVQEIEYHKLLTLVTNYLDGYKDVSLAARRERALEHIKKGVPKHRGLLLEFKYVE